MTNSIEMLLVDYLLKVINSDYNLTQIHLI